MATVFIKPTSAALKVPKPAGDYLAVDGEEVELTTYWRRRLRDGDVVKLSVAAATKAQKATEKAKGE